MEKESKIYVAGHNGMVGSSIVRRLRKLGYNNIVLRTSNEVDLKIQNDVEKLFNKERPDYVFLAAARVGGVYINSIKPAEFFYDNLLISTNVIHYSKEYDVKKLCFLGSGCIYPKNPSQPIKEESLLTSELEKTNEGYSIAKISGLKMCEFYNKQYGTNYISVMPANAYGYGDNYSLESSHVIPGLIRKFHEAKEKNSKSITMWGSGEVFREFIFIDDIADACIFLMNHYSGDECVNVGVGNDLSINKLAEKIKSITKFNGEILHDFTKPDGVKRRLLDSSKIYNMGWRPRYTLDEGLKLTYNDYLINKHNYRN
jgi:GDP-L-fucose synthetase